MMKNITKVISLVLCCILLISIAACGGGGSNTGDNSANSNNSNSNSSNSNSTGSGSGSASVDRDTLRIAITQDFGSFSFMNVSGGQWWSIMWALGEPLFDLVFNEQGEAEYVWLLATGYDVIEPLHWILHLREGVTFSNGNPFTAEDVLFTINTVQERTTSRAQSIDMEKTSIIDDYTIDFWCTDINVQKETAWTDMYMFDAESYADTDFGINPVGTGPYVLTDYLVNSYVKLTAREDYWGEQPAIKNLEFRVMAETSQVINALETGLIDVGPVAGQDYEYVAAMPGYVIDDYTEGSWAQLCFNITDNSIFSNQDARYAVCYAINKQAIVDLIFLGHAEVMTTVVNPAMVDYEDRFNYPNELYQTGYDLAKAKEYAAKAGIEGETITLITGGQSHYIALAEMLQDMLKQIGLTVVINNYDVPTFNQISRYQFDQYDLYLSNGISPNKFMGDALHQTMSSSNMFGINGEASFEGKDRYFEISTLALNSPDPQVRSDTIFELLKLQSNSAIRYSICTIIYSTAFTTDLQPPFPVRVSQQRRFQDYKFK